MSNDVANCPYCEDGLITEGHEVCICDRCGRRIIYNETLGFGARIDNNRYRKRNGMEGTLMTEKRWKEINQLKNNINIILKYVDGVSRTRGYLLNEKEKEAFNYLKKYIEVDFE